MKPLPYNILLPHMDEISIQFVFSLLKLNPNHRINAEQVSLILVLIFLLFYLITKYFNLGL